ncbi:MAG: cytochrome b/b6 domain-containing protein [Alphaproteobacteria bacterium]|nr:cytochrome b/b6 domain-containing protein [Alphaproteobacteria bacterium]
MRWRGTPLRYGPLAQVFHWLTAALVLAAYILSVGGPEARVYSAAADGARRVHEFFGMLIFGLVLLRVAWRRLDTAPPAHPGPVWMVWAAKLTQLLLYALLIAIPLTAILGTWLEGHPLTVLSLDIAPAIAPAHALGQRVIALHTTLGNVILWIAGFHAAAALLHHFYLGDGVLRSMLPGRR